MTTFDASFTSKLSLYAAQTDFEKKQSMKSRIESQRMSEKMDIFHLLVK